MASGGESVTKRLNMAKLMESFPGNKASERGLKGLDLTCVSLGDEVRTQEFLISPDVAYFNHGSYGSVPRRILDLQDEYQRELERHPDFWFRLNAKTYIDRARQALADFVGGDVAGMQLVTNATTAINCVVRSFPFKSGDGLLHCNATYGAIINLCEDFTSRIRPDVENVRLDLQFPPPSEDEIVRSYEDILTKHPNIKLTIIDHITSPTSVLLPIKRLIDLCHQRGVKVILDGAHTLGQLPLNLRDLGADIYTSNAHKWLFTPRGCAMLYLSEESRGWVHPPNTSWQIGKALDHQFFDQGTKDHIPFICSKHGLEFYQALGGVNRVNPYNKSMADKAVQALETELGLKPAAIPKSMEAPNIRLVELPPLKDYPFGADVMWDLHRAIFGDSSVFLLVVPIAGKFYLRLITQVYVRERDIDALVKTMKEFLAKHA